MIHIKVETKADELVSLTISGHAQSDEYGKDLVCAGVSSIGIGALNALDRLAKDDIKERMDEGYIKIDVLQSTEAVELILKTVLIQLETIALAHPEFIKITKMEV